jgi:NAD(P)-dependent dehydrogenase (short-subunit alcohol dehydrogenase family)
MEGLVALVTGASQTGTGRSVAIRFAAEGAKVGIAARNEEGLQETLRRIEEIGGEALLLPCDLGDPDGGRDTLVARTEEAFGPVDVLVNNAVAAGFKRVEDWTVPELDLYQQVNVWAPWLLMAQVIPGMRERHRGWILNLTSASAELPPGPPFLQVARDGYASYGATKASINRLTVAAAAENEGAGIAVNALSPQASIAKPGMGSLAVMQKAAGRDDVDDLFEPVETMAEAALALCTGDPAVLTGRIAYSLQLLVELDRPVYDLSGTSLVEGVQPADMPEQIRGQIEFHLTTGGPDRSAFDRVWTPLPSSIPAAPGTDWMGRPES